MPSAIAQARKLLIRGILAIRPLVITFWLVSLLFHFVNDRMGALVGQMLVRLGIAEPRGGWWGYLVPVLGMLVVVALLMAVGLLVTNLIGKRMLAAFERLVLRIPLIRTIYTSAKQLLEAITVGRKGAFREVVAFEYPRKGIWVMGFVSSTMPGTAMVTFAPIANPTNTPANNVSNKYDRPAVFCSSALIANARPANTSPATARSTGANVREN